ARARRTDTRTLLVNIPLGPPCARPPTTVAAVCPCARTFARCARGCCHPKRVVLQRALTTRLCSIGSPLARFQCGTYASTPPGSKYVPRPKSSKKKFRHTGSRAHGSNRIDQVDVCLCAWEPALCCWWVGRLLQKTMRPDAAPSAADAQHPSP